VPASIEGLNHLLFFVLRGFFDGGGLAYSPTFPSLIPLRVWEGLPIGEAELWDISGGNNIVSAPLLPAVFLVPRVGLWSLPSLPVFPSAPGCVSHIRRVYLPFSRRPIKQTRLSLIQELRHLFSGIKQERMGPHHPSSLFSRDPTFLLTRDVRSLPGLRPDRVIIWSSFMDRWNLGLLPADRA